MTTAISALDSWGTVLRMAPNNKPGIILSSNAVCVGSPVVIMLQKSKEISRKLGVLEIREI